MKRGAGFAVSVFAAGALALWAGGGVRRSRPVPPPAVPAALVPAAPNGRVADGAPPARLPGLGGRRVRAALDRQIAAAGLAGRIGEDERASLLAALARVRRSARRARRRTQADPAADAAHARAVLEADRLFRETLGIGIAGFIAAQGPPRRIEDLGAVDVAAAGAAPGR